VVTRVNEFVTICLVLDLIAGAEVVVLCALLLQTKASVMGHEKVSAMQQTKKKQTENRCFACLTRIRPPAHHPA
jgi:hypothetical protein